MPGERKAIAVYILSGRSAYGGTTRNGVSSLSRGSWPGSFSFEPVHRCLPIAAAVLCAACGSGDKLSCSCAVWNLSIEHVVFGVGFFDNAYIIRDLVLPFSA